MAYTVADLIERLQELPEDAVVRIAHQPTYPLQFALRGVADSREVADWDEDEPSTHADDETVIVWLVDGDHPHDDSPYAPSAIWDAASM